MYIVRNQISWGFSFVFKIANPFQKMQNCKNYIMSAKVIDTNASIKRLRDYPKSHQITRQFELHGLSKPPRLIAIFSRLFQ